MATLHYQLRIRNAANSADDLVITSIDGGTNPYIAEPPSGDGQTVNPVTGEVQVGGFTIAVIDAVTAPNTRVVTSMLADAQGRQQLQSRRAFIEESENGGGAWTVLVAGYVNKIDLVTALRFVFVIGESRRAEQRVRVFEHVEADFDRASCILGGPIIGNFGPYADEGRPVFTVASVTGDKVLLTWVNGPLLPSPIHENNPPIPDYNRNHINRVADHYRGAKEPGGETPYPDLICRLFDVATLPGDATQPPTGLTVLTQDFVPLGQAVARGAKGRPLGFGLINSNDQIIIRWPDAGTRPDPGDRFKLAVFPRYIDDRNPLHWTGHPVDLATGLLALRGETYNAASAATVKAELGPLQIELRITKSMSLTEALESIVYGPFGVGARTNAAGEREFFATRRRPSVAPVDVISNDELTSDEGVIWSLEERTAVNKVSFKVQVFSPLDGGEPQAADADNPIDWLGVSHVTVEAVPDPAGGIPEDAQTASYELPGGIVGMATGTAAAAGDLDRFVHAIGVELFDFQGRGAITSDLHARRGTTTAQVGQEIVLNILHLPTASPGQTPKSQRGTVPRVAVILRRTPTPSGLTLKVQDRGIADPILLVPTFSLAASALAAKKSVAVTILNGGTLAAAGVLVRVETAVSAALPTSGQLVRYLNPAVDALVFDLPMRDAGSHVWVRLRAELKGQPAGPFSAFQDVALASLSAPSSLVVTPSHTTLTDLTWVVGEAAQPVEVLFRLSTDTAFTTAALLPEGSNRYTLNLPEPATSYVIGVRHRERPPSHGTSSTTTSTITTGEVEGLQVPLSPVVYAYGDGIFGMEVYPAEFTAAVEFWSAVETGVSSGVPGAYSLVASQRPRTTGAIVYEAPQAPNDGKLRYLKARHVRPGSEPSEYTGVLAVDPWTPSEAPAFPIFHSSSTLVDTFTRQTPGRRWRILNGIGSFLDVHDPDAKIGSSVGRMTGPVWAEFTDKIPYDPSIITCMVAVVRQLRDPSFGGKECFLGIAGFAQAPGQPGVFAYINQFGAPVAHSQHYLLASGLSLPAGREWTTLYAFFKGYAGRKVPVTAAMLSHIGLGNFDAAACVDGDTDPNQVAFDTNGAVPGACLIWDLGRPRDILEANFHMSGEGSVADWVLEVADDLAGPWTPVER